MISITLTRGVLTHPHRNACSEGLALFDAILAAQTERRIASGKRPLNRLRVRWTPLAQLWLARDASGFSQWLFDKGLAPSVNLSGANLSSAYLSGAYRSASGDAPVPGWCIENSAMVRA